MTTTDVASSGSQVDLLQVSQSHASPSLTKEIADRLKRDVNGLFCAVVQDYENGDVLMVGWMNDEALARTLTEGRVTFWSRSRSEYWRKGDTSGHKQYLKQAFIDCDGDALLLKVDQIGSACHEGTRSCFEAGGELPCAKEPHLDIEGDNFAGATSIGSGGIDHDRS